MQPLKIISMVVSIPVTSENKVSQLFYALKEICCCFSVSRLCPTLQDPVDCSMPNFPVLHCLPEFAQTHVH